jgi:serine/threonine-protein kinase RsbW
MSRQSISFEIQNNLVELDRVCTFVTSVAEQLALTPKTEMHLHLAIEEMFTNIVSYGFPDNGEHRVRISITHEAGCITICIEDEGVPFDPTLAAEPDTKSPVEDRDIGGLGIHLCKKLMDNIEYRREGNKNILTMKKNLPEK